MWIEKLSVNNFRNYNAEEINLSKGINVFYGENAQGKTNIIEAIFLCAVGKSFRAKNDRQMINVDSDTAVVEATFKKSDREGKVKVVLDSKKNIFLNGVKIKKLSDLISNLNIVIFTPDDINILKGSPDKRRRFLDMMIGQLKPNYIFLLNNYRKVLEQRNFYLRQIREEGKSEDFLDVLDEKLIDLANKVYIYRKEFVQKIEKELIFQHKEITDNRENISIKYVSDCSDIEKFKMLLLSRRKVDIFKGFTSKGVHRDDFSIFINGRELSVFGSQGQHRTAVLSLKLAELSVVKAEIDEYPILLLDDFMSELDKSRIHNFLEKIGDIQVIITCTDKFDIEKNDFFVYNVKDGYIYKEDS